MFHIGIQGTRGKTTTAYLIRSAFNAAGLPCGMIGSHEYDLGAGETAWSPMTTPGWRRLDRGFRRMEANGCRACVTEIAERATDGRLHKRDVRPYRMDVLALTNVIDEGYHRAPEYWPTYDFSTPKEYRDAVAKTFGMVRPGRGAVVVNAEDTGAVRLAQEASNGLPVVEYQTPEILDATLTGIWVRLRCASWRAVMRSRLLGRMQAQNFGCALAVAFVSGLSPDDAVRGMEAVDAVPGRLEPVADVDGIRVVIDESHPRAAMRNTLDTLREVMREGTRIHVVFGWRGGRPLAARREFGRILEDKADVVYLTADSPHNEDPWDIAEQIREGMTSPERASIILDREEAAVKAVAGATAGDVVFLAGRGADIVEHVDGGYARVSDDAELGRYAARRRAWRMIA